MYLFGADEGGQSFTDYDKQFQNATNAFHIYEYGISQVKFAKSAVLSQVHATV